MHLRSTLDRARSLFPHQPAVTDGSTALTYAALGVRVDCLAGYLAERGVGPGDRIAAVLPNSSAYLETYYAAATLAAILVPLNYRLTPHELQLILRDSETGWLIVDESLRELAADTLALGTDVREVLLVEADRAGGGSEYTRYEDAIERGCTPPDRTADPDAVAQLYYTSGTTGRPKGVMLTHRNVLTHALGTIAELGLGETDVWGHIAPMFHLADAWATFAITWVGGRHAMLRRFEAAAALRFLERERVTLSNLIPTMLNLMVKDPACGSGDYTSLRLVLSGGAPIAPEVVRQVIAAFGCEYVQTYGLTETSPFLTFSLLKEGLRRLPSEQQLKWRASTGRPFVAAEVQVVRPDGGEVARDGHEVGEIVARGPTVTPGYWRQPGATAEAFRDGWLLTGDLAVVDQEGYLTIVDRRKDVILTGGETVYSTEVEHVLYRHPAVLEAAAYGAPDPIWGEIVAAAVVLKPGAVSSPDELTEFCAAELAGFKRPRRIELVSALPRTGSGKILKRALRDRAGGTPVNP